MPQEEQSIAKHIKSEFRIDPKTIACILEIIAILLAVVSAGMQFCRYSFNSKFALDVLPYVDVDSEHDIPTIYSYVLLFTISAILASISSLKIKEKAPHIAQWIILAVGFLYLSFDEGSGIHELLMPPMNALLGSHREGFLYFSWVVPAFFGIAALGILYIKFLIDLPAKTRWGFLLAALVYLGGAVGVEMIGADDAYVITMQNFQYCFTATIEETLEMSGEVIFILVLLTYIKDTYHQIHFRLQS